MMRHQIYYCGSHEYNYNEAFFTHFLHEQVKICNKSGYDIMVNSYIESIKPSELKIISLTSLLKVLYQGLSAL